MIVWLASYPRSGNTFLRVILKSVFGLNSCSIYDDTRDIAADGDTADVVGHEALPEDFSLDEARSGDELFLIKTHEPPPNTEDKAIYLVRDGRETSVSYTRYLQNYGDSDTQLIDVIYGNVPYGTWGQHIEAWQPTTRPNTLLIKFEELVDAPDKFIKPISEFLEISSEGQDIPSFEELKKVNPAFFRSGKKRSWEGQFTAQEYASFMLKNRSQLMEYGYATDYPEGLEQPEIAEQIGLLSIEQSYLLTQVRAKLSEQLEEKNQEIRKQEELVKYFQERFQKTRDEFRDTQLLYNQKNIAYEQLQANLGELKENNQRLRSESAQADALQQRLAVQKTDNEQLKAQIADLQAHNQHLKSRNAELQECKRELKSEVSDLVREFQTDIGKHQSELENATQELAYLREEFANTRQRLADVRQELSLVYDSKRYKIGAGISAPFNVIRRAFSRSDN